MFWKKRKQIAELEEKCKSYEERISGLHKVIQNLELSENSKYTYIASLNALCDGMSIEDKIAEATNCEFALEIMKKQLEDQLLYIDGADESLISTVQFKSVEEVCKNMISLINVLLQTAERRRR